LQSCLYCGWPGYCGQEPRFPRRRSAGFTASHMPIFVLGLQS
jgi:hypothetical protein